MAAINSFEIVDIGRNGSLRIQLALTEEPWLLPADTLVLPATSSTNLGVLGESFKSACGSEWPHVAKVIDAALNRKKTFDAETPLLVKLPPLGSAPNLANLILVTSDGHPSDAGIRAIIGLANRSKIKSLILPLFGSGAKGADPVRTAETMLEAVRKTKNASLNAVMFTTLDPEARQWLLDQKAATGTPLHRTATSLLAAELASLKMRPSSALWDVFSIAGHTARQRTADNGQLTTSLILFAAVWLGSKRGPGDELEFLTRLSDEIYARAGSLYRNLFTDYFRSPPEFGESGDEPSIEALSPNTRNLLHRAATSKNDGDPSDVLGVQAFLIALLDSTEANASNNLKRLNVDAASLRNALISYIPQTPPRPDVPSTPIPPAPTAPIHVEPPEPAGDYISRFNNDVAQASGKDLLSVADEVLAFSRLAASRDVPPPLSIGVFGDWGAGKSFFMERMYAEIENIKNDETHQSSSVFYTDIVQIRFNAWHYIETNLWASLVEYIFSELDRWLRTRRTAENDPKYEGPRVDALFAQLATSRQLKLDSYHDLIATRRDLRAADNDLNDARKKNEEALRRAAERPPDNRWAVVVEQFLNAIPDDQKKSLEQAVDNLGLTKLSNNLTSSANELAGLINGTRTQTIRSRTLANALIARLGSPSGAAVAAGVVLAAPLAAGALLSLLHTISGQWLDRLSATIIELASSLSAIIAVAGVWLRKARTGLDQLDELRSKLDKNVATQTDAERRDLARAQVAAERARQAIAEAEKRFAAAKEREVAAKQDFENESARGRLNRFIRGKVADASYAKHLGIIASIRKDFGQLTDIMQGGGIDSSLTEEIRRSNEQYLKKLDELLASLKTPAAAGQGSTGVTPDPVPLLRPEEKAELESMREVLQRELTGEAKSDLPSFERIILYIDDLDRCPPDKVVDVLQAIHLLLYFPSFVVVVAVDARWVSRSLMVRYNELIGDERAAERGTGVESATQSERRSADAQDYLEKIFQLPYWVRRMDATASHGFIESLAKSFDAPARSGDISAAPGVQLPSTREPPPSPQASVPNRGSQEPAIATSQAQVGETPPPNVAFGSPPPEDQKGDAPATRSATKFIPMTLSEDEQKTLAEFARFAGSSPRRAKRYLNLYLLLKTSLQLSIARNGQNRRVAERSIVALLAVVTARGPADALFRILVDSSATPDNLDSLLASLNHAAASQPVARAGRTDDSPSTTSHQVIAKLIELNRRDSVDPGHATLSALRQYAPTVRRYSF
jgi:hypothetical protein